MTDADVLIGTIGKYIDIGLPLIILLFIGWWAIKYAPGLVKAANNLGDSMKMNTSAVCELKNVFNVQGDQLKTVTDKIQGAVESLGRVEARQVKAEDYAKLYDLVLSMQKKMNELHIEMTIHVNKHKEEL